MKKIVTLTVALIAMVSASAFAAGMGVVDMKQIWEGSPKAHEIKTQLEKKFSPQKNQLQKMAGDLQTNIQKYQKNKAVMNKKDLSALQSTITTQETAFRKAQAKFQQDVFTAQNEKMSAFMASVKSAVKQVAQKNKLDVVLPENDVLYIASQSDITQDVLKELH